MKKNVYVDELQSNKKIDGWLEKIASVKHEDSADLLSRIADEFEDDLLEHETLPDNYLRMVMDLLSNDKYYNKPGAWNFLLALNNIIYLARKTQIDEIVKIFQDNFENYNNSELCFSICDFVARNFSYHQATSILKQLKEKEGGKTSDLQGYADEGFFILNQEMERLTKAELNEINSLDSTQRKSGAFKVIKK